MNVGRFWLCQVFLLIVSSHLVSGQLYYSVTKDIESVYDAVWEMDHHKAYAAVANVKSTDPNNLLVHLLEDYIDFTKIFLTDDLSGFEAYRENVGRRLDELQRGDASSPYYYYAQAEIYIHWSLVRGKNGETIRAGWDINRAYKLLKKCKKEHPDFLYVDKSLSVIHTLMGSVKGIRKTFIKLLTSLDGTIEEGIKDINDLYVWDTDHPSVWSDEIKTVQSLMSGHILKDWERALSIISEISDKHKATPLGRFLISSTASHAGKNDEAINHLIPTQDHDNQSFYYLDFLGGAVLLNKKDTRAKDYFQKYLDNHHGQNFLKAACQKMAWFELIMNDDIVAYKSWMSQCLTIGATETGEDQEAQQAALSGVIPHRELLTARLLYDGGYYSESLRELDGIDTSILEPQERLEYAYRKGRVFQTIDEQERAVPLFKEAIVIGRDMKVYYACNSALQLAHIYFDNEEYNLARDYVDMALDIHPSERKDALHNEAKIIKERIEQLDY